MKFKEERREKEWELLKDKNPFLYNMILDVEKFSQDNFQIEPVITNIWESIEEVKQLHGGVYTPNIHEEYRAVDLRSSTYNPQQIQDIVNYIDKNYTYDPQRPQMKCVLYHTVGAGWHFHFQNHPKSEKKNA